MVKATSKPSANATSTYGPFRKTNLKAIVSTRQHIYRRQKPHAPNVAMFGPTNANLDRRLATCVTPVTAASPPSHVVISHLPSDAPPECAADTDTLPMLELDTTLRPTRFLVDTGARASFVTSTFYKLYEDRLQLSPVTPADILSLLMARPSRWQARSLSQSFYTTRPTKHLSLWPTSPSTFWATISYASIKSCYFTTHRACKQPPCGNQLHVARLARSCDQM